MNHSFYPSSLSWTDKKMLLYFHNAHNSSLRCEMGIHSSIQYPIVPIIKKWMAETLTR